MQTKGFTIVELLMSIAIIGILVGLAVVGYSSWQQRMTENAIKSDLQGVQAAMESARNFSDTYPLAVPTTFRPSSDIELTYEYGNGSSYCISGTSSNDPSIVFHIVNGSSTQSGECPAQ